MRAYQADVIMRGVIAIALIGLAAYFAVSGQPVPEWLAQLIVALIGAWFGVSFWRHWEGRR